LNLIGEISRLLMAVVHRRSYGVHIRTSDERNRPDVRMSIAHVANAAFFMHQFELKILSSFGHMHPDSGQQPQMGDPKHCLEAILNQQLTINGTNGVLRANLYCNGYRSTRSEGP
jgi:hypothetical protein